MDGWMNRWKIGRDSHATFTSPRRRLPCTLQRQSRYTNVYVSRRGVGRGRLHTRGDGGTGGMAGRGVHREQLIAVRIKLVSLSAAVWSPPRVTPWRVLSWGLGDVSLSSKKTDLCQNDSYLERKFFRSKNVIINKWTELVDFSTH